MQQFWVNQSQSSASLASYQQLDMCLTTTYQQQFVSLLLWPGRVSLSRVFSISIKVKASFFVLHLMLKRRPVQMKFCGCSVAMVLLGSSPSCCHFSVFLVFFCGFQGQLVAGDSCLVSQLIWPLEWKYICFKCNLEDLGLKLKRCVRRDSDERCWLQPLP